MPDLDIKELCEQSRVTPRTVHFYIQQGLLPPASSTGPGARYSVGHLARLRLIRLLQKQHLPLAEIAKRMKGLSDAQVEQLVAEARERRTADRGTALDYIRGVLAESSPKRQWREPGPGSAPQLLAGPSFSRLALSPAPAAPATPAAPARSQWERYELADGFELHVRRPLARTGQRQLERLMAAAREVFQDHEGEEQS
jgi:DNA-binding transcriptional MerR regulator